MWAMKVVVNGTCNVQTKAFYRKRFFDQRKNFLYLPKNDKFFKRKKVSHPPEIADFPFKEHFFIFTQN